MNSHTHIIIKGARENNLKNVDLSIPKNKLVVLTGLSGSGKSSIAFDTLQKECQRQYMESMGLVTDNLKKPKVDSIIGLSPSISIGQRLTSWNTRSTVGTSTEVFTYLRVLYAKIGKRTCPNCHSVVEPIFDNNIQINIWEEGEDEKDTVYCPKCNKKMSLLTMSDFSFNKLEGACSVCSGLGIETAVNMKNLLNEELSLFDGAVDIWSKPEIKRNVQNLENASRYFGFDYNSNVPVKEYNHLQKTILLYGIHHPDFKSHFPNVEMPSTVENGKFEGVVNVIMRRYKERANDPNYLNKIKKYILQQTCHSCKGTRLKESSRKIMIGDKTIIDVSNMSLYRLEEWIKDLPNLVSKEGYKITEPIVNDLSERIRRLNEAGVGYLSLNRSAASLSAGEAQRLRIASLLGSGLTGVLYVLDEPTTGLHQRDTERLIKVLKLLRDLGNTVLVIEHDVEMIKQADYIIDVGPGAGNNGGKIIACGTPVELKHNNKSITGKYLDNNYVTYKNKLLRKGNGKSITILGAKENNLKNIDVSIPLEMLVTVTGVSGSGKSTLLFDILDKAARQHFYKSEDIPGKYEDILGFENIDGIITIDQSPIGRTPRSNAATYTDVFTGIRKVFAQLPESIKQGLKEKHFSFNVPGGRCPKCEGAGVLNIPMHFLPDVHVKCPSCKGKRFIPSVLKIKYKEYNISDILNMTIEDAMNVFKEVENVYRRLSLMNDVGLGYLHLGQSATTLSGGEAQRIKLAKELSKSSKGHMLYILDEPATGLHPQDTNKLVSLLDKLVDKKNTVIVIEHNVDVMQRSDWIIDIGLEGGEEGGYIIAQGTPKQISKVEKSITGKYLC